MEQELQRLSSFNRATWPHSGTSLTPERLAAAGFFASPTPKAPDRVVCFSCENALTNWDPTDDPWIEHKTWYPACNFVLGKATGNVPIQKAPASSLQFPSKGIRRERPVLRSGQVEILVNDATNLTDDFIDTNASDRAYNGAGNRQMGVGLNSYIQNLKSTSSKEDLTEEVTAWPGPIHPPQPRAAAARSHPAQPDPRRRPRHGPAGASPGPWRRPAPAGPRRRYRVPRANQGPPP